MSKHHGILGIPVGSKKEVIKRAFRKQAMQWHPDRNTHSEAENRFIEIHKAYEILIEDKPQQQPVRTKTRAAQNKPNEKYRHVYRAPTDPEEYRAWRKFAEERARNQAKTSYTDFKAQNEAFLKSPYYWVYLLIYIISVVFIVTCLMGVLLLTLFAFYDNWIFGLVSCVIVVPVFAGVSMYYKGIIAMASMFRNR